MSIEINITDTIVEVTPSDQQVDINITENPIEVNVIDQIVLIAKTGLPGPAGPGVAVGGSAGQILAKNSSTNYDTIWINDNFVYEQQTPSDTWIVLHNLNKYASVSIVDTANDEVVGQVNYNGLNQVTITFSSAVSGKAYIN